MSKLPLLDELNTETVAYWFFRINGCLNLTNFLVHHERRGFTATEVDILAVRFPYRKELAWSLEPMDDHEEFKSGGKIDLIFCEVKSGRCDLNGPWTDPDKQNMHRVLHAIGAFTEDQVPTVADSLYRQQRYEDSINRVRLMAVGKSTNTDLLEVPQLTWNEVLAFIYQRFRKYEDVKAEHNRWDDTGKALFKLMQDYDSAESYTAAVLGVMGLASS